MSGAAFARSDPDARPLIAHVVYGFAVGGLENGVVNLINHLPARMYRHAVVALTEVADEFARRIERSDVEVIALHKPAGHGFRIFPQLHGVFRRLAPAIVHTRNLAALEATLPAWLAGVPARVHGEHGWDVGDIDGRSAKHRLVRRAYRPFVTRYVALSRHLEAYLRSAVGVPADRVTQIYNGVDTARFFPARGGRAPVAGSPFADPRLRVIGTVGRMQTVKDPLNLVRAFVLLLEREPSLRGIARLAMIGDGPLRREAQAVLAHAGVADLAWLPGERSDVPEILRGIDCFVLPSLAEGISNTILEAMASGLPVIATAVGGNPELIEAGRTGELVPPGDAGALAQAMRRYVRDPAVASEAGWAGRERVERLFSLDRMLGSYDEIYRRLLDARAGRAARVGAA
jgi:sugar transferase (PEP-CTERM/EpsH1 system associated)